MACSTKIRLLLFIAVLTGIGFSGCLKIHPVSDIPTITFQSFVQYGSDSAALTINFQDGDGDIGQPTGSSTQDLFLIYYGDSAGKFKRFYQDQSHDSLQYSYSMPYSTPSGPAKATSGTVRVGLLGWNPTNPVMSSVYWALNGKYPKDTIIRFNVYIFDRAGHKSNTVTTTPIHISPTWHN